MILRQTCGRETKRLLGKLADELIKDLNLKQSILRFFERMADRNVLSLSEMTPDVWAWIHQHHFEDRFTIKISNKERG